MRFGVKDFVLLGELGAFPPVGPVDDIGLAIFVDVAEVGPLGKVDIGELLPLEPMDLEVLARAPCSDITQQTARHNGEATERGRMGKSRGGTMSGKSASDRRGKYAVPCCRQQTSRGDAGS